MSRGIAVAAGGFRRRVRVLAAVCAIGALAACSQPPAPASGATDQWNGRLALQVEDAASQSFSAGFELQGRPERGQLTLLNPLGNVIATLEWEPGQAVLVSGQERRVSASLDALVQELLGGPVPVTALFGWLQGDPVQATGWQADLSALPHGRIVAQRFSPPPQATLRIALSQ